MRSTSPPGMRFLGNIATKQLCLFSTIADARETFRNGLSGGVTCPCCDRHAQIYKRKLNSAMAISLIWLVKYCRTGEQWAHFPSLAPAALVRTNQLSTLKLWGLIERKPRGENDKGKHSGYWKPTESGRAFADETLEVPSFMMVYNDQIQSASPVNVGIRECLGTHFDYDDLMTS
jgi:hypothetical protein